MINLQEVVTSCSWKKY